MFGASAYLEFQKCIYLNTRFFFGNWSAFFVHTRNKMSKAGSRENLEDTRVKRGSEFLSEEGSLKAELHGRRRATDSLKVRHKINTARLPKACTMKVRPRILVLGSFILSFFRSSSKRNGHNATRAQLRYLILLMLPWFNPSKLKGWIFSCLLHSQIRKH